MLKKFSLKIFPILPLFLLWGTVNAATLILSPATGTIPPGQSINVDIMLDTQGADIDGVDIYSLHYNTSILQVVDANASVSGVQITPGSLIPLTLTNTVNSNTGVIQFSQVTTGGATFNGSGKLATITFKALAGGTSPVTFDFTLGNTSDTNVAGAGQDKLTSVGNGNYTVSGGTVDTTPPVVSSVSTGSITTSSVNITWTTNESADSQVEYGTTSFYGSSSSLVGTPLTSHSVTLNGLSPATLYHFRIKSSDAAGNLGLSGDNTFTTLSSNTNNPPPPPPPPGPPPATPPPLFPPPPPPPPTSANGGTSVNLKVVPASISVGEIADLQWQSTDDVTSASIDQGIGEVGVGGSRSVKPKQTTTYTITAIGPGGIVQSQATVTVKSGSGSGSSPTPSPSPSSSGSSGGSSYGGGQSHPASEVPSGLSPAQILFLKSLSEKPNTDQSKLSPGDRTSASISYDVSDICPEKPVVLQWSSSNATEVTLSPNIGRENPSLSGEITVHPYKTSDYFVVATNNKGGYFVASTTVHVKMCTSTVNELIREFFSNYFGKIISFLKETL
jgi:hypothetical protein